MFLHEVFRADRIRLHIEAEDKEQVFEELVTHLVGTVHVGNKDEFLKVIRDRENIISTGIKDGIAIPHGKIENFSDIAGVLGISDKGIEYGSLDNNPARIIFMRIICCGSISRGNENALLRKSLPIRRYMQKATANDNVSKTSRFLKMCLFSQCPASWARIAAISFFSISAI